MKKLLILFIVLENCACSPDKELQFSPSTQYELQGYNFYKDSEHFRYTAYYGPVQVGELTIDCPKKIYPVDSLACYHVVAQGSLKGLAGEFSSLSDTWDTYIDTSTLMPYKFSRDLKENKYKKKEYTIFKRDQSIAEVFDTSNAEIKFKTFPITGNIQDMISSYFLFRNVPFYQLKEGDTLTSDVFLENASYNVKIKYLGKEKIKTNDGKKNTLIIAPLIPDAKILSGEYPVKVWLSDDDRKIPLKAEVKIFIGSVEIQLREYQNGKFPQFNLPSVSKK